MVRKLDLPANNGLEYLYVNGLAEGTPAPVGTLWTGGNQWKIGQYDAPTNAYFDGTMDEVEISTVARSADWIAAQFNNQSSPQTFYSVLPQNLVSVTIAPPSAGIYPNGSQQFAATAFGSCVSPITWTISPSTGSISSTGLYTPPAS